MMQAFKKLSDYGHQNDNKGYVVVGTINGTNISVGSATAVVDDYFMKDISSMMLLLRKI